MKQTFFQCLLMMPVWWTFTGLFAHDVGRKVLFIVTIISVITSISLYGWKQWRENLKYPVAKVVVMTGVVTVIYSLTLGVASREVKIAECLLLYALFIPNSVIRQHRQQLPYLFFLSAIVGICYVYFHMEHMGMSRYGWGINAVPYGAFLAVISIVSLVLASQEKEKKIIVLYVMSFLIGFSALMKSETRGAILAVAGSLVLFFIYLLITKQTKLIPFVVLSVAGVMALNYQSLEQRLQKTYAEVQHMEETNTLNTSGGYRLQFWKVCLHLIKDNPIVGYGRDTRNERQKLIEQGIASTELMSVPGDYHNQYINSWVQKGALGIIMLFLALYLPVQAFRKKQNKHSLAAMGLASVVSITSLTDTTLQAPQMMAFYFMILLVLINQDNSILS